jgi:ATP-dependent Lon protease
MKDNLSPVSAESIKAKLRKEANSSAKDFDFLLLHYFIETIYAKIVTRFLDIPKDADKRDVDAISYLCEAFIKLLFPQWTTEECVIEEEFVKYCLEPAKSMRQIIRTQLGFVKPKEFKNSIVADVLYKS